MSSEPKRMRTNVSFFIAVWVLVIRVVKDC